MCVRIHIFCFVVFVFNSLTHFSQPHVNDIAVSALPGNVRAVLEEYLKILRIEDIDECMRQLVSIVGGNLVNYDCSEVLRTVRNYYLKSDRANIKSYKNPTQVIRVNKTYSPVQGEGDCAIQGFVYKIWLAKTDIKQGNPGAVSIMVPEHHPVIVTPKVVQIGML